MREGSEQFLQKIEAIKCSYRKAGQGVDGAMFRDFLLATESEMVRLKARLASTVDKRERRGLSSFLVKLEDARVDFYQRLNRKPPEAGIAVPADLPKGPKPRLGGAEAPLHFDRA